MNQHPFVKAMNDLQRDVAARLMPGARHDAECTMRHSDPVLAALLRMEAIGDQRCDNDVSGYSKLTMVRNLARVAIEIHTGKPFENPLYPGAK